MNKLRLDMYEDSKEKNVCGTEVVFQKVLHKQNIYGKNQDTCKLYPFTLLLSSLSKATLISTWKKTTQSL